MSRFGLQLHTPHFSRTPSYGHKYNHTSSSISIVISSMSGITDSFSPPSVKFGRPQRTGETTNSIGAEFGHFVAREAQHDQEYWTAACLRAESHWEDREHDRYVESYKRKFAEQEFNEMKRRYNAQLGEMCKCIVMVSKEDVNVNRTILKSVVGTLDLSVRCMSEGQKFPREVVDGKSSGRYGYITNLCVAKSSRRQGVASSMLHFALASAKAQGADKVFVQVYKNNISAQGLYQKMGFQVLDAPTSKFSEEQTYLLCLEATNYL